MFKGCFKLSETATSGFVYISPIFSCLRLLFASLENSYTTSEGWQTH